jgi:SAM-dependent methyltransferase
MRRVYRDAMSFAVPADAYRRFMGRFSEPLALRFVAMLAPAPDSRVLDVGCGPGALTEALAQVVGPRRVCAVDPSAAFVAAVQRGLPEVDARTGTAERLPWRTATFDLTTAQLVLHFLPDPVAGLREMARVTRPGGRIAASVWDHGGTRGPLAVFWRAVHDVDPGAAGEHAMPGTAEGQLTDLCVEAELADVVPGALTVTVRFTDVEDWWDPFTLGVGPAGAYVAGLDDAARVALRRRCAELLPPGPFDVDATAWVVTARTPAGS